MLGMISDLFFRIRRVQLVPTLYIHNQYVSVKRNLIHPALDAQERVGDVGKGK